MNHYRERLMPVLNSEISWKHVGDVQRARESLRWRSEARICSSEYLRFEFCKHEVG